TRWRRKITKQRPRRSGESSLQAAMPILLLLNLGMAAANAQLPAKPEGSPPSEKSGGQEFAPRGQREAREIRYSDWRKTCFKTPGTNMVCRTSIAGTFETGQSAVRIELIEREGEKVARLRLFLPVGLYLQAGVRLTIDQGATYRVPYMWCLTNTCIAADVADPKLLKEMETGQKLLLEVVDSSVLTVSTSLPLNQFATVRQGTPAQTFEQAIDE
ncbi:invasion associated locus B family protein, partial [Bradyrhizobium sp.]|uniref:invasion associated locus B family protein n=1 Tax=Bradyrhizobium sp. TaxID=376 RepID=UPI003C793327